MLLEDCILEFKPSIRSLNGFLESLIIFLKIAVFNLNSSWLSEENSFTTAAVFDLSGGRATY